MVIPVVVLPPYPSLYHTPSTNPQQYSLASTSAAMNLSLDMDPTCVLDLELGFVSSIISYVLVDLILL
jgi:hypothetical protein